MPRPKGSKNKKTLAKTSAVDAEIAQVEAAIADFEKEQEALNASLAETQEKIKVVKKNIRTSKTKLAKLQAKKVEAEAAKEAEARSEELQAAVKKLLSEGQSYDDVLARLK